MKKILTALSVLIISTLVACGGVSEEVEASLPIGFELVSKDEVNRGDVYKARETATGCYYIFGVSNDDYRTTVSIEQMFIEKDGVSVPYCY